MKKKTMLLPLAAVAAALMITACGQKAASSETSAANASETATKAGNVNAVASLSENQVVQDVPAIKNKKIIEMDYDDVMDYGARVIDSAEKLYDFMYEK